MSVYEVLYTTGNSKEKGGDDSFRRAAETHTDEIRHSKGFDPKKDVAIVEGVYSKGDFKDALKLANDLGPYFGKVKEVSLFSHGGPVDGPTFHGGEEGPFNVNGAINFYRSDGRMGLPKVNWDSGAVAQFFGCHTASSGFTQRFANEEGGVRTGGYTSTSDFSSNPNHHEPFGATGPLYQLQLPFGIHLDGPLNYSQGMEYTK
jgi:hypothetical protein